MKQDSAPQNRNECALCKQEFGRLINLPHICSDCGRYVCSACSVELPVRMTHQSKFVTGNRTWVPITSSTTSLNLTPIRGFMPAGRTRHTSEHLSDTSGRGTGTGPFRVYLPNTGRPNSASLISSGQQWIEQLRWRHRSRQDGTQTAVCKICREAREIWKRSGAWFYKTLPRSQMASCPTSPTGLTRTPAHANSPTDLVGPSQPLSETDNNEWVQLQPRSERSVCDRNGNFCKQCVTAQPHTVCTIRETDFNSFIVR
ncbi:unnamed protein product [Echinostoma caproni]|uniref:FYVE-type domain-containing protein n=1 Tax=Echinostoma caproni TaxID=27848 RepID=A0A182ZZ69_9TREM|nr:unnamed protein product [Echinostoma caproni]